MIFFVGNGGTIVKGLPEPVYQGAANANTVYLVAPFATNGTVTVAFLLPNGIATSPAQMTQQGAVPGITDENGNEYSGWVYDLPASVTELYGVVTAQFYFYNAQGKITASSATSFTVGRGVPAVLPDEPAEDVYEQILSSIAALQTDLGNGFYAARAIYAWNSAYTYGANEIVYYPDAGDYGAFVRSVAAGNLGHAPYIDGVLNAAWWEEVVNFNTIADDFFTEIKNYEEQALQAAQDAQAAAQAVGSYIGKQVQFVSSVAQMTEEGVLYGLVTDAAANLFDLYQVQNGEPEKIGSADLVVDVTRYYVGVLPAASWEGNAQTLAVEGISANDSVTVWPLDADAAAYIQGGVMASAVQDGSVQFSCSIVPAETITVMIGATSQQEVPTASGYYTASEVDGKVATLSGAISSETAARQSADAGLQESVDALESDVQGILEDLAQKEHFRGYKSTTAEVQAIASPDDGDYAWNAQTGTVWDYNNGAWADTGEAIPDQTVPKSTSTPLMDGTASAGEQTSYAAGDHRHPIDTTRASVAALSAETAAREAADTALGGRIDDIVDGTQQVGDAAVSAKVANALTLTINGVPVVFDGSLSREVTINTSGGVFSVDISVAASAWSGNMATLTSSQYAALAQVTADSLVQFVPADASAQAVAESNVRVSAQGSGSVTFSCNAVPSAAVNGTINIFN